MRVLPQNLVTRLTASAVRQLDQPLRSQSTSADLLTLRFSGRQREFSFPPANPELVDYLQRPARIERFFNAKEQAAAFRERMAALNQYALPAGVTRADYIVGNLLKGTESERAIVADAISLAGHDEVLIDWLNYFEKDESSRVRAIAADAFRLIQDPELRKIVALRMARLGPDEYLRAALAYADKLSPKTAWMIVEQAAIQGRDVKEEHLIETVEGISPNSRTTKLVLQYLADWYWVNGIANAPFKRQAQTDPGRLIREAKRYFASISTQELRQEALRRLERVKNQSQFAARLLHELRQGRFRAGRAEYQPSDIQHFEDSLPT